MTCKAKNISPQPVGVFSFAGQQKSNSRKVCMKDKTTINAVFSDVRFARALDNLLDRKRGVTKEAMNAENAMGNDRTE